ncbi:hypothetical protein ACWD1Y_43325 [Streptomyces sp. NPDC002814]
MSTPNALTAADLPKGTRVANPAGRLGTALGCWTGRVSNEAHPNFGREYTGVEWDADTTCPWGERSRPFVDELTVIAVAARCPAAHPEDPAPCGGPVVVTILDETNAGADGCEVHAVRMLASLTGGLPVAKPDAPAGVAVRVFRTAQHVRPFPWVGGRS